MTYLTELQIRRRKWENNQIVREGDLNEFPVTSGELNTFFKTQSAFCLNEIKAAL